MTYLFSQIFVLLIVAALAGLIVGFLMRSLLGGSSREEDAARERELVRIRTERDEAVQSVQDLTSERRELLSRLSAAPDPNDVMVSQELDRTREELAVRNSELTVARREMADLHTRLNDLTHVSSDISGAQHIAARIPDLEAQLADLQVEANRARALQSNIGEVSMAHASLAEPDDITSDRLANLDRAAEEKAQALQDRVDNLHERLARLRNQGTAVVGERRNDLTQISGVGSRVEALLNSRGIHNFSQLASMSETDIDELDANLGEFSGRVRRDNWVLQARQLQHQDPQ